MKSVRDTDAWCAVAPPLAVEKIHHLVRPQAGKPSPVPPLRRPLQLSLTRMSFFALDRVIFLELQGWVHGGWSEITFFRGDPRW